MRYETRETKDRRPIRYARWLRNFTGAQADLRTCCDEIDHPCIVRCRVPGVKTPPHDLREVDWAELRCGSHVDRIPEVRGFLVETPDKIKKLADRRQRRRSRVALILLDQEYINAIAYADDLMDYIAQEGCV